MVTDGVKLPRICIPDPDNPGARIVGFRIREGDEAWGELGLSEPLFWLDRLVSPPIKAGEAVPAKVKPLTWRKPTDHPKDPDPDDALSCADGIGGVYAISRRQSVGQAYLLWWAHDPMWWTGYDSIDEAKAAAQADYEARILAALSHTEQGETP